MSKKKRRKSKNKNYMPLVAIISVLIVVGFVYLAFFKEDNVPNKEDGTKDNTTVGITTENTTKDNQEASSVPQSETEDETSTEPQSEPVQDGNKVHFDNFTISSELRNLPTDMISLGYSLANTQRDEYNRPVFIENIDSQYGDRYNARFIGEEGTKKVYITFTSGYEYYVDGVANTDRLIEILNEKNVPAIFFVDGGYVRNNPDMCRKLVDNGYIVGCHGWDHPTEGVASYSIEDQYEDAKKIYEAIYEATGVEPYYYRFGSGIWNERALALLSELGFKNVFYSLTYYDYDVNNQPDVAETLDMMIENLHDGEIIYLHTVSNTTVAMLGDFIDAARAKGYEFDVIPY